MICNRKKIVMLTVSQQNYYTFLFQTLKINIIKNNCDISLEREHICISPKVLWLVVPSFGSSVMSWKQYQLPQPEGPGLLVRDLRQPTSVGCCEN